MIIQKEMYLDFISDNILTQSQALYLFMLSDRESEELIERYKTLFPTDDGTVIGQYLERDLLKRNYIKKHSNGSVEVYKKFKSNFITAYYAFHELRDLYPDTYTKDGKEYPLKLIDVDKYAKMYHRNIYSSYKKHLQVLEIVNYANDNNLLTFGLNKFIESKYWEIIQKKMEQEDNVDLDNSMYKDF